jgi:DNA-binding MarR family transcriptional regulator
MSDQPRSLPSNAGPSERGEELAEASRLRAALLRLGRRLRAVEIGADLTPAEFSALATVIHLGPIRPTELARVEMVNPTMLSRMVARMCHAGVLQRHSQTGDKRAAVLEATEVGRELHRRLRSERALRLASALAELPAHERAAIVDSLPALEELAQLLVSAPQ